MGFIGRWTVGAAEKMGSWGFVAFVVLGALALAGVIVGFIGLGVYVPEKEAEGAFRGPTVCTVQSSYVRQEECSEEHCTGSTDKQRCHTSKYTCYRPFWAVTYDDFKGKDHKGQVEGTETRRYRDDAKDLASKHRLGGKYDCWYDTRDYSVLRWEKPDATPFLVMMICGFAVLGVFLLFWACAVAVRCFSHRGGYSRL